MDHLRQVEEIKSKCLQKLKNQSDLKKTPLSAPDLISLFNEVVDLKKLREKLSCDEKTGDMIIASVTKALIDEWLQVHLEQAFKNKLLELYHADKEIYLKKPQNVDDYLEKTIKRKLNDESDYPLATQESLFTSLRKNRII